VTGTPAFFINGRLVSGAQPLESFVRVIEEELARAQWAARLAVPTSGNPFELVQGVVGSGVNQVTLWLATWKGVMSYWDAEAWVKKRGG
jgi:hypothetical protein